MFYVCEGSAEQLIELVISMISSRKQLPHGGMAGRLPSSFGIKTGANITKLHNLELHSFRL